MAEKNNEKGNKESKTRGGRRLVNVVLVMSAVILVALVLFYFLFDSDTNNFYGWLNNENQQENDIESDRDDFLDDGSDVNEPESDEPVNDNSTVGDTGGLNEFVMTCENEMIKGEDIRNLNFDDGLKIPLDENIQFVGEIRGDYCFEANCPFYILDSDDSIVYEGYVTLLDDWMTEEFVVFESGEVVVEDDKVAEGDTGKVIFMKSNPSGLEENCGLYELLVEFGK